MHQLLSLHLLVEHVVFLLLLGLLLLLFNERLDHRSFGHVLLVLVIENLLMMSLLVLGVTDLLLNFLLVLHLLHLDFLPLLLLQSLVHHYFLHFLLHLALDPDLFLSLRLNISLSLMHDISGLFLRLVNFLVSPGLLLLQKLDSIGQQLQILLRSFTSDLGSHQLSVQSFIVVLLVGSQVHLLIFTLALVGITVGFLLLLVVVLLLFGLIFRTLVLSLVNLLLVLLVVVILLVELVVLIVVWLHLFSKSDFKNNKI